MNFTVYEFYLEFMNKGFNFIKSSGLDVQANEDGFNQLLSFITFVRDQFKAIAGALSISFAFIKKIHKF